MIGLAGAGVAGGRFGPSRSQKDTDKLRNKLELFMAMSTSAKGEANARTGDVRVNAPEK